MTATNQLLVNLILYGLLPLWGICGFIDWCCHRATRVERTSGLKESLIHSLIGVQLGIPMHGFFTEYLHGRLEGLRTGAFRRSPAT